MIQNGGVFKLDLFDVVVEQQCDKGLDVPSCDQLILEKIDRIPGFGAHGSRICVVHI
jgi:hypothetical protein